MDEEPVYLHGVLPLRVLVGYEGYTLGSLELFTQSAADVHGRSKSR